MKQSLSQAFSTDAYKASLDNVGCNGGGTGNSPADIVTEMHLKIQGIKNGL